MTYKEQDKLADFVKETVIEQGLGLTNYTDEEVTRLVNIAQKNSTTTATTLGVAIANLTSSRAKAYWGSLDHTSVDVDLYAFSNADYLQQKLLMLGKDWLVSTKTLISVSLSSQLKILI